jgi:hypothetical protein
MSGMDRKLSSHGTNRELMRRIGRALRPAGIVAIWEPVR